MEDNLEEVKNRNGVELNLSMNNSLSRLDATTPSGKSRSINHESRDIDGVDAKRNLAIIREQHSYHSSNASSSKGTRKRQKGNSFKAH